MGYGLLEETLGDEDATIVYKEWFFGLGE